MLPDVSLDVPPEINLLRGDNFFVYISDFQIVMHFLSTRYMYQTKINYLTESLSFQIVL